MKENCSDCYYWVEGKIRHNYGSCHRRINIVPVSVGHFASASSKDISTDLWAITCAYDWCGDFKEKEKTGAQLL